MLSDMVKGGLLKGKTKEGSEERGGRGWKGRLLAWPSSQNPRSPMATGVAIVLLLLNVETLF